MEPARFEELLAADRSLAAVFRVETLIKAWPSSANGPSIWDEGLRSNGSPISLRDFRALAADRTTGGQELRLSDHPDGSGRRDRPFGRSRQPNHPGAARQQPHCAARKDADHPRSRGAEVPRAVLAELSAPARGVARKLAGPRRNRSCLIEVMHSSHSAQHSCAQTWIQFTRELKGCSASS